MHVPSFAHLLHVPASLFVQITNDTRRSILSDQGRFPKRHEPLRTHDLYFSPGTELSTE